MDKILNTRTVIVMLGAWCTPRHLNNYVRAGVLVPIAAARLQHLPYYPKTEVDALVKTIAIVRSPRR